MWRVFALVFVVLQAVSAFSSSPPPGLDALQNQLEKTLMREIVKKAPAKVQVDLNHTATLVATANVTTKTESHAVMTTGSPEDTPVIRLLSGALETRRSLESELAALEKRYDFVRTKCGSLIQGVSEYVKTLKRKGDVIPERIDENPYPHSPSADAGATVIIEGLNRCPDNSCVHVTEGNDDVVSLLEMSSRVPSEEMDSHIEKVLSEISANAEKIESYQELKDSLRRAAKAARESSLDTSASETESKLEEKLSDVRNILDSLEDPEPEHVRNIIDGGKEHILSASFRNAVSFRESLMKRCESAISQIEGTRKDVTDDLESVARLALQIANSREALSEVTWGSDEAHFDERMNIDANLAALIQAGKMRDEAQKHVQEAKELAEHFRKDAERSEESEYKAHQELEGVKRQIYLLQEAAEAAEKYAHLRMSESSLAFKCVVREDEKTAAHDAILGGAEEEEAISKMTALVKSAIAEARTKIESSQQESQSTSEARESAMKRAHEVESSAEGLLSSISTSFLEIGNKPTKENENCVETYSQAGAAQLKNVADRVAEEAANYVRAMELTVDKLHNVQRLAMNFHHRNVAAHKKWRSELDAVGVREKTVATAQALVLSFEKKLKDSRAKLPASESGIDNDAKSSLLATRKLSHEILLKLLDASQDVVDFESTTTTISSFLEISENGILDEIKSKQEKRARDQLKRWSEAFSARSELLDASREAKIAMGRMKIARLKMLQRQLDFAAESSLASDEAGKITPVPSEFAASSAASAAAFLRSRELREALDHLSESSSSASMKSGVALQGSVDDSPVPDGVKSLWKKSDASLRAAVEEIVKGGSQAYLDKGAYANALARLHSTTNEELRQAVKGQLSLENAIDSLQNGFKDVESTDRKISGRVNDTESIVQEMKSNVETRLAEINREVAKWEQNLSSEVSRWKSQVRDRLENLSRDVMDLKDKDKAAMKMRSEHKAMIDHHKNKIADANAQISLLRALVQGVDVEQLGIDSSSPDVKQLVETSKSNDKFLENKGLEPLRKQISEINAETEELNKALQIGTSSSSSFIQVSSSSRHLRGGRTYEQEFDDVFAGTGATGGKGEDEKEEEKAFDMDVVMSALKDRTDERDDLGFEESASYAHRMHTISNEFHQHVLNLQARAAAMKADAENLDHEYDVAKRKSEDSVSYAREMKKLLREKMDNVAKYQRAVVTTADLGGGKALEKLEDDLVRATKEKDIVFAKTQNALREAQDDQSRCVEIHDERFATWRAADSLSLDSKKAAQIAIELQVKAARSLLGYTKALVRHQEEEVKSEESDVHEIGRETIPKIGSLATVPVGQLGFGATAGQDDEMEDFKDLPAPLGRWEPRGPLSFESTYEPVPSSPSGPAPSEMEINHVVQNVVTLLKASEKRSALLRSEMFDQSNEVHKLSEVRADLVSRVSEEPSEQEKNDLAEAAIAEAKSMREFELLSSSYEENLKIVKALRTLLNRKVHLHSEIEHLNKVKLSAEDALEMLHEIQLQASQLVVASTNAASKVQEDRKSEEEAAKQKAYEAKLLESVGLDSLVMSLLELDEIEGSATGISATGMQMTDDIKALYDGRMDDVIVPDWHSVSPHIAASIASSSLDTARHFEDQTLEATKRAAIESEIARRKHKVAEGALDEAEDRADDAENRARDSESHLDLSEGGVTGMARESMGLDPTERLGPTGPALDELNERIDQYRDIVRGYKDDAKRDRQQAQDAFAASSAAKDRHEKASESSLTSEFKHKQSVAVHQRLKFWTNASKTNHEAAKDWLKINEEAEKEKDQQEKLNLQAELLDNNRQES